MHFAHGGLKSASEDKFMDGVGTEDKKRWRQQEFLCRSSCQVCNSVQYGHNPSQPFHRIVVVSDFDLIFSVDNRPRKVHK